MHGRWGTSPGMNVPVGNSRLTDARTTLKVTVRNLAGW